MGENTQKHETTGNQSRYAQKHQRQNAGHFSPNSPFISDKMIREVNLKKAESQAKTAVLEEK
jgi:hypothetical protein